jgi:DNA (cytosine-5)-methyltransferase 1
LASNLRPSVIVLENVPGLLSAGFGRVLGDLAEIGYDAEWRCIPASKAGLPHRRDRLWIVAYPRGSRLSGHLGGPSILESAEASLSQLGDQAARTWRALDNAIGGLRSSDGLPVAAHRTRVKALGNSIVPQIAEAIGRAIMKQLPPQDREVGR